MNSTVNQCTTASQSLSCNSLATLYKACGDSLRLEILHILGQDTYGVLELTRIFSLRQSAMSHHLKVLATTDLVETQREGNSIFYRRPLISHDNYISDARLQLFSLLDQIPISNLCLDGIEKVRKQRAEQSRAFFQKNAGQFKKQQELIASFNLYADPMAELIQQKTATGHQRVLEIGPGEGGFLETLSHLFDNVVAVDNAEIMLEKARQTAIRNELDNIEFVLGTGASLIPKQQTFNAVVMNMVLHHVPSPALLMKDCANLLKPGGMLFISDLNKHHQTWARENCGDVWLGFDAIELSDWALAAGLVEGENIFIGVRNGFQIQLRQFSKPMSKSVAYFASEQPLARTHNIEITERGEQSATSDNHCE